MRILARFQPQLKKINEPCSVQDGIYALEKAHKSCAFRSVPNVAFQSVPMFVSATDNGLSHLVKKDRLALASLHASQR